MIKAFDQGVEHQVSNAPELDVIGRIFQWVDISNAAMCVAKRHHHHLT
jgi:hypothetical protein